MGDCSGKISTICGKKINTRCTTYTGELSENSELDNGTCHTGHDVFEDISNQLNTLFNTLDFSDLGNQCLEYEGEDTEEYLKNILLEFEKTICELKESVSKKGLDLTDLDTKCLKDACDDSPTELLEVLQLLIDSVCEGTTSSDCTCCMKTEVFKQTSGSGPLSDGWGDFAESYPVEPLEFIATETGRYRVRWIGVTRAATVNQGSAQVMFISATKATGSQSPAGNPSTTFLPYIGNQEYVVSEDAGGGTWVHIPTPFSLEFDVLLNAGESIAVDAIEGGNEVEIGENLFVVDKMCDAPST